MLLRDYQERAVAEVRQSVMAGHKKIVMVLPTGAGKSWIMAQIISLAVEKRSRILWLVHRRNLVKQMQETLDVWGIKPGIIMAGIESRTDEQVQLGTIQTYSRRLKLEEIKYNRFFIDADIVLIDEAHRSLSKQYMDIIDIYKNKVVIGTTATPCRSDGRGLGQAYTKLVDVIGVKELTEKGHLSPVKYYAPDTPDLAKIRVVRGDYELKELEKRVNKPKLVGNIVENWLKFAEDRQTIVFCATVKHSKFVSEAFMRAGVSSCHLDAKSSDTEREEVFSRMESGELKVVCNVMLYVEGMDCPKIGCVVIARPTKSLCMYRQACGRGLRPYPGKQNTIVLDHAGVIEELGYLDDDIEWTLDGKEKAWKEPKKREKKEKGMMKCSFCNFVYSGGCKCPECGNEAKSFGRKVETVDAELKEMKSKKKATVVEKRRFLGMLRHYIPRQKNPNPKRILAIFRSTFGVWPHSSYKDVGPIKPDKAFLNRMKYEQIRFAKSKRRE